MEGHPLVLVGNWNRCSNKDKLSVAFKILNLKEFYQTLDDTSPVTRTNRTQFIDPVWCSSNPEVQK